ncbi:MAG: ankyrin repeat domain-containing protein [Proteobacteria bacterium]|nr:ankyrin repeat domain-containing protein [Pseudomonadota bacterium]MBU1740916.1 ankyrin repeat domain-containing protein [Pseudomonadota bacterium]
MAFTDGHRIRCGVGLILALVVFASSPPGKAGPATIPGGRDLIEAVRAGDEARVRAVLRRHPQAIDGADAWGRTALHWAAVEGHVNLAELLLDAEADVNAENRDGETPLHEAVFRGWAGLARLLLARGAYVNARNKVGVTPLHYAAGLGRRQLVEILLDKGAEVNARTVTGLTPLASARRSRRPAVARLLRLRGGVEGGTPGRRPGPKGRPTASPRTSPGPARTRAAVSDVVRAFFRAGARGDVRRLRRHATGKMLDGLPSSGDDLYEFLRIVCIGFESVGRVQAVGRRATAEVFFNEALMVDLFIRARWGRIVHPRRQRLAKKFVRHKMQSEMGRISLILVHKAGRWLVADLLLER